MAKKDQPDRSARPPGMIVTSITVVDLPQARRRPLRFRLSGTHVRRGARAAVVLAAGLVAMAAIALIVLGGQSTGPAHGHRAPELQLSQRTAIAKALGYPYPLRCLTIAVFADDPEYATAEIDRANGCAQYRGYIYASLHRIGGRWRLMLDEGQLYIANGIQGQTPGSDGGDSRVGCLSAETLRHDPLFASQGSNREVCARPQSS